MTEITAHQLSEELTHGGVTVADISISFPSVTCEAPRAAKRINAFYAHWAKALLRAAKKSALAAATAEYAQALETSAVFKPMNVTVTYEVTYNDGHVLSLHRDVAVRSGGTTRAETRLGDTWCVSSGWLIGLRTFFPRGERLRRMLTDNAAASAAAMTRAKTHSLHSNFARLINRKFSPENYYITDRGIVIFYARGDIAPEAEGVLSFVCATADRDDYAEIGHGRFLKKA